MILGLDAGTPGTREAEHLAHEVLGLLPAGTAAPDTVCTHTVTSGGRHQALTLGWQGGSPSGLAEHLAAVSHLTGAGLSSGDHGWGPRDAVAGAREAEQERSRLTGGRLTRFPGQGALVGRVAVLDLVASSAVDDVEGLAGVEVRGDSVVDTLGWVRPTWRAGRVVLLVQGGPGGVLIPFEVEHQIACCADH